MRHHPDLGLERAHFDAVWAGMHTNIPVHSRLEVPGITSLKGKRVLICACGTGVVAVEAANSGAQVYAVDISPQAVRNAAEVAKYNGVEVQCSVQDLHHLDFPSDFFDFLYGNAVLHHLDIEQACREFGRVLTRDGVAVFREEPTFMNPLLKFAYETAFCMGREGRRRKFGLFTRIGTENEKPFDKEEFEIMGRYFPGYQLTPSDFMFFQKLSHVTGKLTRATKWLDTVVSRFCPPLRKWSYEFDIFLPKGTGSSSAGAELLSAPGLMLRENEDTGRNRCRHTYSIGNT